jgi:hypothetical protein
LKEFDFVIKNFEDEVEWFESKKKVTNESVIALKEKIKELEETRV